MVLTRYPLVEKMTLFWHGHFATGIHKVRMVELMKRQNDLLRRRALGSFPALLRELTIDPAMLLWLDGSGSTRRSPNENYAREVMELFTCGPGPYTETDVQEAARAFTGWRVNRIPYRPSSSAGPTTMVKSASWAGPAASAPPRSATYSPRCPRRPVS